MLGVFHKLRQAFFEDFRPPMSDQVRYGGPPPPMTSDGMPQNNENLELCQLKFSQ